MTPDTDPDFPNIVKPDPQNPVQFQQPVRVGDHEKVVAKAAGEDDIWAERNTLTQKDQPALGNKRDLTHAEDQKRRQDAALDEAKTREHKAFLDANNVRTEDQAEREEASIAKGPKDLPEGHAKQGENRSGVKTGKLK